MSSEYRYHEVDVCLVLHDLSWRLYKHRGVNMDKITWCEGDYIDSLIIRFKIQEVPWITTLYTHLHKAVASPFQMYISYLTSSL